jgi:hypothetical protein
MIVTVQRKYLTPTETIGELYIDGKFQCYTLEDTKRDSKVKGKTRIPAGTYALKKRYSPRFSPIYKHDMLWVYGVPGFEYILIHPGNTAKDTEGCLLVGELIGKNCILKSRDTYNKIYPIISKAIDKGEVTIIYKDENLN